MSSMKSFNLEYLIQNLKKSKAVLAVIIGLVPLINILSYLVMLSNRTGFTPSLDQLSIINLIAMYILPIILSVCLFGFVFKRKSVDFVGSMPITKKTIFVTNAIGGIFILIAINLINALLILLLSLIFSNIFIPFGLVVDYFIVWSIIYIFVFMATNIAMSISGNAITQVVVTMLILFLVPFIHTISNQNYSYQEDMIICKNDDCTPEYFSCYEDQACIINKSLGIYQKRLAKDTTTSYTTPYQLINLGLFSINQDGYNLYDSRALVKMAFLSIIYYIIGLILFKRKKLEVSETSFKSFTTHLIVKDLTLIPMVMLASIGLQHNYEIVGIMFIFALILTYYFVYDLITKKGVTPILKNITSLFIAIIVIVSYTLLINNISGKNIKLSVEDIKSAAVVIDNEFLESGLNKDIYIENKELINILIRTYLESEEYTTDVKYIVTAKVKTASKDIYTFNISLTKENYDKILTILSNNKQYNGLIRNIDYDKIYAISVSGETTTKGDNIELINLIKEAGEKITLNDYLSLPSNSYTNYITLYSYEHHQVKKYTINPLISTKLTSLLIENNNKMLRDNLKNNKDYNYSNIRCGSGVCQKPETEFIINYIQEDIFNFVKENINNEVDLEKEILTLYLDLDGKQFDYTTNSVTEFINIINNKREEIKDSEDYKNWVSDNEKYVY